MGVGDLVQSGATMKVTTSTIKQIKITEVPRLDPIDVMLEDIEPGKGRIVIRCYTKAWTAYWGAMGDRTIAQFFCDCDEHYLAGGLSIGLPPTLSDGEAIFPAARREICKMRRANNLNRAKARELFDGLHDINGISRDELWNHLSILTPIFGDEWWYSMPSRPNPEYEYLCRIIKAVQEGLALAEVQP